MTEMSGPTGKTSKALVEAFFSLKEKHDLDGLATLFTDDVVYTFPLPASGAQEDWFVYDGKEATVEYQRKTLDAFSQLKMRDMQINVSEGNAVVFVESRGDYITKEGKLYKNVYIFKFLIEGDRISRVYEYANPVTYALLVGLPIAGHEMST